MGMKRNKNGVSKERIIMLASAVLVLTVLTATGIFVRSNRQTEEESNVLDFSVIETDENALPKEVDEALFAEIGTDDLDYDPSFQEANSDSVENVDNASAESGNSSKEAGEENAQDSAKNGQKNKKENSNTNTENDEGMFDENKEGEAKASKSTESEENTKQTDTSTDSTASGVSESSTSDETAEEAIATTVQPLLDFNEEDGLMWPIVGNILINYSMDKTIYFATLQQYKYNPGIVIAATEGETITAAADGRVVSVDCDSQLGNMVVMDLGNQYELTYGQLDNITVSEGSYVAAGDIIGSVAHPTKYYSSEGANIFFKLTKDGEPVNPMSRLSQ